MDSLSDLAFSRNKFSSAELFFKADVCTGVLASSLIYSWARFGFSEINFKSSSFSSNPFFIPSKYFSAAFSSASFSIFSSFGVK